MAADLTDPALTDAEAYVELVKEVIDIALLANSMESGDDLRRWWIKEAKRRKRYNLSPEQEAEITEMCRVAISILPPPVDTQFQSDVARRSRARR